MKEIMASKRPYHHEQMTQITQDHPEEQSVILPGLSLKDSIAVIVVRVLREPASGARHHDVRTGSMVWYGIVEFNDPLDTW